MKNILLCLITLAITAIPLSNAWGAMDQKPLPPNVDVTTGALSVPDNYTLWPTLGTWTHANAGDALKKKGAGVSEHHVVYTQPETITHYQKTGQYPDGAVLVKELLHAKTMKMRTGPAVGHATTLKGWFVMVRDTEGRYKESGLWGDGWAWSFFKADDPQHTTSTNYKTNCLPCHMPARKLAPSNAAKADKWIYSFGYPVLRAAKPH